MRDKDETMSAVKVMIRFAEEVWKKSTSCTTMYGIKDKSIIRAIERVSRSTRTPVSAVKEKKTLNFVYMHMENGRTVYFICQLANLSR